MASGKRGLQGQTLAPNTPSSHSGEESPMPTVAVVQSGPVPLDLAATLEKTLQLISDAAALGADLVVFPETWLPGYPAWLDHCPGAALWDSEPAKAVFARLRNNSIAVPGPEVDCIASAARAHGVTINISAHEHISAGPGRGTLYNTMLTFGETGELLNAHRKLVPTYTERLLWGRGDGSSLRAIDTKAGRVGGLICWEHWMPLARQAMHNSGEDIHVAVWPMVHDIHQLASRHYAFEGRCFVAACGTIMRVRDLPLELPPTDDLCDSPDELILRGGSAVIAPDGTYIAGPVYDKETILVAECDPRLIAEGNLTLDVAGHYSRPDVFDFSVRGSRH